MKKRNLLLLALLLIPFNAKAEASMTMTCDKTTADPNTEVHCTIVGKDTEVSGAEGDPVITNGTIVSSTNCGYGGGLQTDRDNPSKPPRLECIQDVENDELEIITYTIKVGESGTTTFAINNAKLIGYKYATIPMNLPAVNIAIKGSSSTEPSNPDPVNPDPGQNDPEPSDPGQQTQPSNQETNVTPSENKNDNTKKENIKNPETGSFLNVAFVVVLLSILGVVLYNIKNKKKLFKL